MITPPINKLDNFAIENKRGDNRVLYLDILKCFAIFLVIWGHTIQYFKSTVYFDEPIYRIIYSFHMPLFMALSGYFSESSYRKGFLSGIIKRGLRLLLPIIPFTIFILLLTIQDINISTVQNTFFNSFWFLKSAFICWCLNYAVVKWFKFNIIGIIGVLFLSQLIGQFQVSVMYPAFLLGYILKIREHIFNYKLCCILSAILFVVLLIFWNKANWTHTYYSLLPVIKGLPINGEMILRYYHKIFIGLAGSVFFITLFKLAFGGHKESEAPKWLNYVGRNTLGIYLIQTIILENIASRYINFDSIEFITFNFLIVPTISIIFLMCCIGIIHIINKFNYISFFCLGEPLQSRQNRKRKYINAQN